jgi:hypothetical protein
MPYGGTAILYEPAAFSTLPCNVDQSEPPHGKDIHDSVDQLEPVPIILLERHL